MYKEVSGPGGTVTDTQVNTASSSANSTAQAKYDSQLGGGKRGKKGGNPNWLWGCYSGGKCCPCVTAASHPTSCSGG